MSLSVDDVLILTFSGTLFEQRIMTVLRMVVVAGDPGPTNQDQLEAILTFFNDPVGGGKPFNELLDCQTNQVMYSEARIQRIYPFRTVYYPQPCTGVGTGAGNAASANIAAVVRKRSNKIGRTGIGSVHVAGIAEVSMTSGLIEPGLVTELSEFGATLKDQYTMPASTLAVRFCTANGLNADETIVTATSVDDRVKTMRRRTLRVGE